MDGTDDGYWSRITPQTLSERLGSVARGHDELDLHGYQLTRVPPRIRGFTHVRSLFLYQNRLTSLPAWLAELTSLTLLDVTDNLLTDLPFPIMSRPGLEVLRVYDNPLDFGRLFRGYVGRYNAGDLEAVAATCHPDVTIDLPGLPPASGRDGVLGVVSRTFPLYGRLRIMRNDAGSEVALKPARAGRTELELTWRDGRLYRISPAARISAEPAG